MTPSPYSMRSCKTKRGRCEGSAPNSAGLPQCAIAVVDMNDLEVEDSAMEELVGLGREEFPDAPNLDSTDPGLHPPSPEPADSSGEL
ncbi:hypothetical protein FH972_025133 [Carpinus fangiana]|uniref:Uncharacterized protein n=1 Tax=Carpinus fangiana TaxID=176857 RepID=A0A5N6L049_9ROSI|nr:hypothetical protein FH972_025133 [Carpinus fangiana]